MKQVINWLKEHREKILVTIISIVCVCILVFTDFARGDRVVVYDCRDAHWHPDVPVEIKKACSEMFKERYQKEQRSQITI
jgi:hypothetical protein